MKAMTVIGNITNYPWNSGFGMGGFSFTDEKKDVDMGPIQIGHEQKRTFPIPQLGTLFR
jgi:hypothetical protein